MCSNLSRKIDTQDNKHISSEEVSGDRYLTPAAWIQQRLLMSSNQVKPITFICTRPRICLHPAAAAELSPAFMAGLRVEVLLVVVTGTLLLGSVKGWGSVDEPARLNLYKWVQRREPQVATSKGNGSHVEWRKCVRSQTHLTPSDAWFGLCAGLDFKDEPCANAMSKEDALLPLYSIRT